MRKPFYILLLLASPAFSFSQTQSASSIVLETFKSLPKEIDGCSETCSYMDIPLKDQKYVWITNLQGLGMIKVNGQVVRLHRVSRADSGKNHKEVYKGSGYVIVAKMKEIRETGDEESYMTGTLEISYGDKVATFVIHGSAGC
jgi:hypothetical protein